MKYQNELSFKLYKQDFSIYYTLVITVIFYKWHQLSTEMVGQHSCFISLLSHGSYKQLNKNRPKNSENKCDNKTANTNYEEMAEFPEQTLS